MKVRTSNRRNFFFTLSKRISAIVIAIIFPSLKLQGAHLQRRNQNDPDAWFNNLKGKHKIVFDAIGANDGFQIVWAHTFLSTNNQLGIADSDLGVMVVLRNKAIGLAMQHEVWKKYKLGKFFKVNETTTNTPALRNPFLDPDEGEMPEMGMSIKALMKRGVLFCVCETAIRVSTHQIASASNLKQEDVKKDWLAGVIPGIQAVPSGVLALNRAQERGASYCYAG